MNPIIHLENICKSYFMGRMELKVLKGISLDIFKNEYVALMGPSGSGKSTLMNILGCLDTPTSGTYILNQHDVSKMMDNDLAEIRNKEIGFVFQQFNLLPRLTALENVALPLVYSGMTKKLRNEKAKHVLELVKLTDRGHHKPNELSGGQCQRVAIARALVNDPSIILADEPTGNLDSTTSYEIMQIFSEIHSRGNTVILVTHETDIANYAKRIVRLKDGMIESDGNNNSQKNPHADSLKAGQNEYEKLVKLAHSVTYNQLNLPEAENKEVLYGVIMDWGFENKAIVTLVCFINGEVNFYISSGTIIKGMGQYEIVKDFSARLIEKGKPLIQNAIIDNSVTMEKDMIKFYLMTNKNKYVIKDKTEDIISKKSLLSDIFYEANELITTIRGLEEKINQGWSIIEVS